jgi:uncharacterized protein YjbI with pentapeptide repeats
MQEKTRKMLPPDELNDILGDHRRWLESEGTRGRRANLRGCDLSNRDLFGVVLKMAVLKDIDFSYASLREIDFHKAQIFNTDFTGSDLRAVDFTAARLENVNFQGTNLYPKYFQKADWRKCTFDRPEDVR